MALSAKIRAICQLYRGTRSHKGTFELWSVNSTGNWHQVSSLIMDSSSLSGQRERLWAHGIPPSRSRRPFGLLLAYNWNCFLIKKAIHIGRRGKVRRTVKSKSPSHPVPSWLPCSGGAPVAQMDVAGNIPEVLWAWTFPTFHQVSGHTPPGLLMDPQSYEFTLNEGNVWLYLFLLL